MKRLTVSAFRALLDRYLTGEEPFASVRAFIYDYYEAEKATVLDRQLDDIFPILAPYIEYEESRGDPLRDERLRRVRTMLDRDVAVAEGVLFGLEFNEIRDLARAYSGGLIPRDVFERKLRDVSPAKFDTRRVALWALAHAEECEPDPVKMS